MMLGTSPAHEALIHGAVSSSRGVPAAKQSASPPRTSTHGDARSASPARGSAGLRAVVVTVRDGQRQQHDNPGLVVRRQGDRGPTQERRRRALAPSPSPTVTGFAMPSSSSAENSVGDEDEDDPARDEVLPLGFPRGDGRGFRRGIPRMATESVSASPPMSPGGLSRSISALRGELSSVNGFKGGVEPTNTVPVVTTAQRPTMHARGRAGLSPEKPPIHRAAGGSGLLSGRLEALTADEEAMLLAAQARHDAFSSPAVVSAFRVAAAAHRGQLRKTAHVLRQVGRPHRRRARHGQQGCRDGASTTSSTTRR